MVVKGVRWGKGRLTEVHSAVRPAGKRGTPTFFPCVVGSVKSMPPILCYTYCVENMNLFYTKYFNKESNGNTFPNQIDNITSLPQQSATSTYQDCRGVRHHVAFYPGFVLKTCDSCQSFKSLAGEVLRRI